MLFAKKLKQEAKEDFALILNPVRNEIAKSRIIERMAEVFPLTLEEAGDLVENTPIILLEGLAQEVGEQIRKYMAETNAEVMLTDDQAFRRKCFRAIWPTPPNLSFLQPSEAKKPSSVPEEFDAVRQAPPPEPSSKSASDPFSLDIPPHESSESDSWRKEKLQEVERLTEQAIRNEKIDQLSQEKEKLQQLISNLQHENERLRTVVSEKDRHQDDKNESAQDEISKLKKSLKTSEDEKNQLKGQIQKLENEFSDWQKRSDSDLQKSEEKRFEYEAQLGNLKSTVEKQLIELQETKRALEKATDTRAHEAEIIAIQNQKIQTEKALEGLKSKVSALEKAHEEKIQSKDKEIAGLRQKSEDWSTSHASLTREFEELRRKHASDLETLATRNQELQTQNEAAQKQLRDYAAIAEQQELIDKRNRLAAQLLEKESLLRELGVRHEILNSELKDREGEVREILSKREQVEKEIQKDRQADKYLFEQLKLREKEKIKSQERFTSRRSSIEISKPAENGLKHP